MSEGSSSEQADAAAGQEGGGAAVPIRLAVLGGGPSALTALYHITEDPERRRQYDITVYQMGWRLGGKGASGRAGPYGKIQEHGLHVLFGFYENFFAMIRACYAELDRPHDHPLATWDKAFVGHNFGVVEEFFEGRWQPWDVEFPTNDSTPGDGDTFDTPEDYFSMLGQTLVELIFGWRALHRQHQREAGERAEILDKYGHNEHTPSWTDPLVNGLMRLLEWPLKHALNTTDKDRRHRRIRRYSGWFRKLIWPLVKWLSKRSLASHRFWLGIDYFLALIHGIADDRVFAEGGFNSIDHLDFREWLRKHGAHELTLQSPYGRTVYDAAFSYRCGDPMDQRVAAGAALRCSLRMSFTYKGSNFYKMSAGMGDTVFGPLYEVLKKRGVRFKFFHKVEALRLSEDSNAAGEKAVAAIEMIRQAELRPELDDYDPMVNIKHLPCWPASPRYEQLQQADELRRHDLESYYDKLPESVASPLTLEAGRDYDKVLWAIPIGAVPYVCEDLVNDHPRWKNMVKHVQSVTTVSFQLWFKPDLKTLGWDRPSPLLSLYVEPLNTWADMSQVIPVEDWPSELEPGNIGYYTGAQKGPELAPDPRDPANANFEIEQYAEARRLALEYCENSVGTLLPGAVNPEEPPILDWNLLIDPHNGSGRARFDQQYWRSNCGPSERCTIALPGATEHRMKAGDTGYSNLCVTGDWTDNGFYVACMEGTIMSGIHGARAVTGVEFPIIGEHWDNR